MTKHFELPFEALAFDFDGTLAVPTVDFVLMRRRAAEALSAVAGRPVSTERPAMETLAEVCRELSPEAAAEARAVTLAAIVEVEIEAARRSALFPFVRPLLPALAERGIPFAVITRNCPAAVRTVFPDIDEHCACFLTRDDVARVKPHPEHLERALAVMRSVPERTLMVGDHPMDITVGKAAGTLTAGVASGGISCETLAGESPDYLAQDAGLLMASFGILIYHGFTSKK